VSVIFLFESDRKYCVIYIGVFDVAAILRAYVRLSCLRLIPGGTSSDSICKQLVGVVRNASRAICGAEA
jgi:hypothetical protein